MLDDLARVALLDAPTPLERLARMETLAGHGGLWVKRDDAMPLGLGGNKLRSLEFWLGEARARGCDMLVVAGAPVSNQCRLTAAVAAKLGLDCLILHSSDEPARDEGNLLLNRLLGAEIRFLGPVDEAERGRLARAAVADLQARGRRPYLIGDPVVGALGYMRAAEELAAQAATHVPDLRHVVLPGSMGPTEAGFLFGCAVLDLPWRVHLVSVEYDADDLLARMAGIIEGLARHTGLSPRRDWRAQTSVHMDQLGAGYGQPTEASRAALHLFASHEALFLEHVYTAKTFAGLLAMIGDGRIAPHEPACVLHTGGVPALFAQAALDPALRS